MQIEEFKDYPLEGTPYFDNDKKWVSPINYMPEAIEGMPKEVYIHDVTLRDGEQTPGVTFREDERVRIACALAELGVKRIEAGMPITSEGARKAFKRLNQMNLPSQIVAFARANPKDIELTIDCGCKYIVVEHSINPYFCKYAYKLDEQGLVDRLITNIKMAKDAGLHTTFMGWDFTRVPLDVTKKIYDQVFAVVRPDALSVVDTYGCATPFAVEFAFKKLSEWYPWLTTEFHVHNDFQLGVAGAMAAVRGGAKGIHTAINALGERTGNVSTEEVVAAFELLMGIKTGVDLEKIYETCKLVAEVSKMPIHTSKPIVGERLFNLESGVVTHYTHLMNNLGVKPIPVPFMPEVVGRPKGINYVIGKGSGKVTIEYFLEKNGLHATSDQIAKILEAIKDDAYIRKSLLSEDEFVSLAKKVL